MRRWLQAFVHGCRIDSDRIQVQGLRETRASQTIAAGRFHDSIRVAARSNDPDKELPEDRHKCYKAESNGSV